MHYESTHSKKPFLNAMTLFINNLVVDKNVCKLWLPVGDYNYRSYTVNPTLWRTQTDHDVFLKLFAFISDVAYGFLFTYSRCLGVYNLHSNMSG